MVVTLTLAGCGTKTEETRPVPKVALPEADGSTLTKDKVCDLANRAAEAEGYELKEFAAPKIGFDSEAREWSLFFEGTVVPAPGNHFSVLVDDRTGKASVRHGE